MRTPPPTSMGTAAAARRGGSGGGGGGATGETRYAASRKYSIMIAGHATSIRIEPMFWDALCAAAVGENLPINALIARIDAERLAGDTPPNLASALRQWVLMQWLTSPGD